MNDSVDNSIIRPPRLQLVVESSPENSYFVENPVNNSSQSFNSIEDSISNLSLSSSENISIDNMAEQHNTEQLISAARNFGDILPKFDGNPNSLETFIIKADRYYQKYGATEDETLSHYVFCMISSKFINEASDFVSCRSDLTDWPMLKDALRNKFGDLTDRKILAHQFKNLKIKPNEEFNDFIERLKSFQNKLNLKTQVDPTITAAQRVTYREIHEQTAIEVLYSNCPPMLQTILDVKNPLTLNEASSTVLNYVMKHPIEKQKPKPTNFPKPQFFRPPQPNFPRPTYFRPPENNRPYFSANGLPNIQRQPSQINPNVRNFPQTGNNFQNRHNTVPNNRPTQNPSASNVRSNRFQGTAFRNWRQPRPQVNFTELCASEQENYYPENLEYGITENYFSNSPENSEYYEHPENPENPLHANYWSMNETYSDSDFNYPSNLNSTNNCSQLSPENEIENFRLEASETKQ